MKITEKRKPLEAKCPICHKAFQEWYCPFCGLPISTFHRKRPEDSSSEFQLCDKCNTPNPHGAKYCKNCGENITLHAKDKDGHGWIDLGLSVLWSTDTMPGYYFWMDSNDYLHNGQNMRGLYNISGKDVATEHWVSKWRMPTKEEFEELVEKCQWEKVIIPNSNKLALKVIGPNGNHILLPATGVAEAELSFNDWRFRCHGIIIASEKKIFRFWTSTKDSEKDFKAYAFTYSIERDVHKLSEEEINALWLSTPFNKEYRFKNLLTSNKIVDRWRCHKNSAFAIRPVADKQWRGKL